MVYRYRAVCMTLMLGSCFTPVQAQDRGLDTSVSNTGVVIAVAPAPPRSKLVSRASPGGSLSDRIRLEKQAAGAPESASEFQRLKDLPPLDVLKPSVVIGTDDRKKVTDTRAYPYRAVVLITMAGGRCSGALIGPDTVLTAGHCVHSGGGGGTWSQNVTVYPGRNGPTSPYGSCTAKTLYSVLGWTRDKNAAYDYGAIKLNCKAGNTVGWFGFYYQPGSANGTVASLAGYPGERPLEQWFGTGSVTSSTDMRSVYNTDTTPGNSGGGVYVASGPGSCGGPCIHVTHAYGNAGGNFGTRLYNTAFQNYLAWRNAP